MTKMFPVIDPVATGENIVRLRKMRGLTVRDLQKWFGFEEPQAIYKWQKGKTLPSIDNLYALGALLEVPMEEILVPCRPQLNIAPTGQQAEACCLILLKSRGVLAHTLELPGRRRVAADSSGLRGWYRLGTFLPDSSLALCSVEPAFFCWHSEAITNRVTPNGVTTITNLPGSKLSAGTARPSSSPVGSWPPDPWCIYHTPTPRFCH